jgi:hypothetical protein
MEENLMRDLTIIGFVAIFTFIAISDSWAHLNSEKLIPLGKMVERLMSDRTVRIAFGFIWWWIGWHFLYSNI